MKKIFVVFTLCLLFVGCSSKSTPEKTVKKYIDAYNRADFESMLECVEPSQANALRAIIKLSGDATGIDFKSIMDLAPIIGNDDQVEYEIVNSEIDGEKASVEIVNTEQKTASIKLILVDDVWYIYE